MKILQEYNIKPSSWRDLKALDGLEKTCFGEDAWPLIELLGIFVYPGVIHLKAEVDSVLVGFIAGDPRRNENTGWILTLGVLPDWRRRGIAETFIKRMRAKNGYAGDQINCTPR